MDKLSIWQQNVNKSLTCQHNIISNKRLVTKGINIIALQEPALSESRRHANYRAIGKANNIQHLQQWGARWYNKFANRLLLQAQRMSLDLHPVQDLSPYKGRQGHTTLTKSWKNAPIVKALLTCLLNALSSSKEHGCHHCRDKRPLSLYL